VGNEEEYYAIIDLDTACDITVTEYYADSCEHNACLCTDWEDGVEKDTDEYIGTCEPTDNCEPCPN